MAEIEEKIESLAERLQELEDRLDLGKKQVKIGELEAGAQNPDFWNDKDRAVRASQELADLKEEAGWIQKMKEDFLAVKELADEGLLSEFEKRLKQRELEVFLGGKYDRGDAILSIMAGAGGQDSQDWATMLLRMYQRYAERKGFKVRTLEQSFGEPGGPEGRIGTKSATLEIKGKFAFGFLKKETGVHRLVRQSPFNAKDLRQTSFAQVEVLPLISGQKEIEINPADLKIDFYRSSGPGGQYVNKRETAVRVTHLPTGLVAACQSERNQADNREKAMDMLTAKILRLLEESKEKELSKIKGEKVSASWGNQIRSYVLHPYKMVKDLRTGVETSDPDKVLDGDLDQFVEEEIKF
ncbi:MAG: peptide chain release factor 2 [Candidatus Nealsonbacteria bacterium]|nr:peptide chain release factor 2 [Candidatus Nealsonbacteria bacterium]